MTWLHYENKCQNEDQSQFSMQICHHYDYLTKCVVQKLNKIVSKYNLIFFERVKFTQKQITHLKLQLYIGVLINFDNMHMERGCLQTEAVYCRKIKCLKNINAVLSGTIITAKRDAFVLLCMFKLCVCQSYWQSEQKKMF